MYGQPDILAVDDEPHVLDALTTILQSRGYHVRTAPDGVVALREIAAARPDVVLLDLLLAGGGIDGVEVCRRVRRFSRVPILVLSALSDESRKVRALDAGADDYVTKPYRVEELLARVRAAIRRGRVQRDDEAVIRTGGIELDQIAHRVLIDNAEVHLTPTQYELLRFFANNPDRVLTRHTILVGVFGPTYDDAHENLRTFVGQLRRKIELNPSRPQRIVTEPGLGYRFRSEPVSG